MTARAVARGGVMLAVTRRARLYYRAMQIAPMAVSTRNIRVLIVREAQAARARSRPHCHRKGCGDGSRGGDLSSLVARLALAHRYGIGVVTR
jgi:hypothetical protein